MHHYQHAIWARYMNITWAELTQVLQAIVWLDAWIPGEDCCRSRRSMLINKYPIIIRSAEFLVDWTVFNLTHQCFITDAVPGLTIVIIIVTHFSLDKMAASVIYCIYFIFLITWGHIFISEYYIYLCYLDKHWLDFLESFTQNGMNRTWLCPSRRWSRSESGFYETMSGFLNISKSKLQFMLKLFQLAQ